MTSDRRITLRRQRISAIGASLFAALALSGCGGVDGIELNGKVFDWMGVSAAAQKNANTEPKVAARTGLVLPPDASRLPAPGSDLGPDPGTSLVNDPDRKKAAEAAERERLHKAYCSGDMTWKDDIMRKNTGAPRSPYGPCSVLGSIANGVTADK